MAGGPGIYSAAYYERLAALEDRHWWSVGMRIIGETLLRRAGLLPGTSRALDAGCGTGAGATWIRARLGAAAVVGVDVSSEALRLFRVRAGAPALRADVRALPFRPAVFDLVVCHDVLQHVPADGHDHRALAELRRVLRPGGLLLVRANSSAGIGGAATPDYRRFTLAELVAEVRRAGFEIACATYANVLPALYATVRSWRGRRRTADHGRRGDPGLEMRDTARAHPWLNRALLGILRVEAWYVAVVRRGLPWGHSTFCVAVRPRADAPRAPGR